MKLRDIKYRGKFIPIIKLPRKMKKKYKKWLIEGGLMRCMSQMRVEDIKPFVNLIAGTPAKEFIFFEGTNKEI